MQYLHEEDSDPRPGLAHALVNTIGDRGSLIAYNAVFESNELKKLADNFPEFADKVLSMESRLWDQLNIFK